MQTDIARLLTRPFDVSKILSKRRQIRHVLQNAGKHTEVRLAILGGSTTSELVDILELFLLKEGIQPVFYQSEFGRFYEDAVVDNAALRKFKPEVVLVHTTARNLQHIPEAGESGESVEHKLDLEFERFHSIWTCLQKEIGCLVIQNNFEPFPQRPLGNLDSVAAFGKNNFICRLNLRLAEHARKMSSWLLINDINYLAAQVGLGEWCEERYWYSYKLALSPTANVALAHNLTKILRAAFGKSRKVLVLDLDNTLWGGVIGDDGLQNLRLGNEAPEGEAFVAFQRYCLELKSQGVLLAVCSKNDLVTAQEGFTHPDSLLKLDDFAAFQANWEPKHENLVRIADSLNLGLESLVFVDDNPAEREIVSAQLEAVAVPDVGSDISRFAEIIDGEGYFEAVHISAEDIARAGLYQANAKREVSLGKFRSYDEYLLSLEMEAEIDVFNDYYLDRIAQLTNKTNQFNLTTTRYTAANLRHIAAAAGYVSLYGRLKDKFSDHGLISVVLGEVKERELHVLLWLMSCRVLKRGMEHAMLDALVAQCQNKGITGIYGRYLRTAKNGMVAKHYEEMGFECVSQSEQESTWRLDLSRGYENRNRFIQITSYATDHTRQVTADLPGSF